jgi:hypothetical protein
MQGTARTHMLSAQEALGLLLPRARPVTQTDTVDTLAAAGQLPPHSHPAARRASSPAPASRPAPAQMVREYRTCRSGTSAGLPM